jgi:hypothetical protein
VLCCYLVLGNKDYGDFTATHNDFLCLLELCGVAEVNSMESTAEVLHCNALIQWPAERLQFMWFYSSRSFSFTESSDC